MPSIVDQLINRPLTADGPITRLFRAAGAHDFPAAALHVLRLPYGRITDRSRFWLVVEEGRGTCTTKHATLAELAREQDIDVQLMLGIYEMSERNTPGVGRVLTAHGLSYIPEAHCYLRCQGERVDMTGIPRARRPSSASCMRSPSPSIRSARTRTTFTGDFSATGSPARRRCTGAASTTCGRYARSASPPSAAGSTQRPRADGPRGMHPSDGRDHCARCGVDSSPRRPGCTGGV